MKAFLNGMIRLSIMICFFYIYSVGVNAASLTIETTWENSCNRVDTVDLWDGWNIRHFSLHADRHVNIGRTEVYKDNERIEFHDTVFYANPRWLWWYSASPCATHSRIASADFESNILSLRFDAFNPQGGSTGTYATTTRAKLDTNPLQLSIWKQFIDSLSVSSYAIGSGFNHAMKLNMKNSGAHAWWASRRVEAFLNGSDAKIWSTLRSSYYYGHRGCDILDIAQTDDDYIVNFTCELTYTKTTSAINGAWFTQVYDYVWNFSVSKERYDLCQYNQELCEEELPTPILLGQYIESPFLTREEVEIGSQIGKYQSGSGMIFTADIENPDNNEYKLVIKYLRNGTEYTHTGATQSGTTLETTLTYQGTGSYIWNAAVASVDETRITDFVEFGENTSTDTDFVLFEGFEPYPFGYKFRNSSLPEWELNGGILWTNRYEYWTPDNRTKLPGNKWDIFHAAFDTSNIEDDERLLFNAFESLGLNRTLPGIFDNGTCYGLSLATVMNEYHPDYLYNNYQIFYSKVAWKNMYNTLNIDWSIYDDPNTSEDDGILEALYAMHLSQKSVKSQDLLDNTSIRDTTNIINELKNNPWKPYLFAFAATSASGIEQWHILVAYRIEELDDGTHRIYVWDNNVPYPNDEEDFAYKQYFIIDTEWNWENSYYEWWEITQTILVDIDDLYNGWDKSYVMGFNGDDTLLTFSWESSLMVIDEQWNRTGFLWATLLEEIPNANIVTDYLSPIGGTSDTNWKQIYLPQKIDDFTIHINWVVDEDYTLMIAGGDYYTKVEWVSTSSGQTDTFTSTRTGLEIDFDDTKTGNYNLLTDNFYNSGTGTVYLDSIQSTSSAQQYSFDWTKVRANDTDAVIYTIDEDNNGLFDETPVNLPPVYQDLVAPTTTIELDGNETPTSTGSTYYDTVNITLTATDNTDGSGLKETYYAIWTGTWELTYLPYTDTLTINGVGEYTFNYYSVDNLWNVEDNKVVDFTLIEQPETYTGKISGYTFFDADQDQVWDSDEKTNAWWKICIDENGNGTCEENLETFMVTNNTWYYEFDWLATGNYTILVVPRQNWTITTPTIASYIISLSNGEVVTDKNFWNYKEKSKGKK